MNIVYDDGQGVKVIAVSPKFGGNINDIIDSIPDEAAWIYTDELPDRDFRNAWALENGRVIVDMAKARVLHMDSIREARKQKFDALGFPVKLHESLEGALVPAEVRSVLKELRDLPQTLDLSSAATPEELKLIWPSILE